jgi:hypothetical protein
MKKYNNPKPREFITPQEFLDNGDTTKQLLARNR